MNIEHSNIIDEAGQTALGNIAFMKDRLPKLHDDARYYAWDPRCEVPRAIDTLGRALAQPSGLSAQRTDGVGQRDLGLETHGFGASSGLASAK